MACDCSLMLADLGEEDYVGASAINGSMSSVGRGVKRCSLPGGIYIDGNGNFAHARYGHMVDQCQSLVITQKGKENSFFLQNVKYYMVQTPDRSHSLEFLELLG